MSLVINGCFHLCRLLLPLLLLLLLLLWLCFLGLGLQIRLALMFPDTRTCSGAAAKSIIIDFVEFALREPQQCKCFALYGEMTMNFDRVQGIFFYSKSIHCTAV